MGRGSEVWGVPKKNGSKLGTTQTTKSRWQFGKMMMNLINHGILLWTSREDPNVTSLHTWKSTSKSGCVHKFELNMDTRIWPMNLPMGWFASEIFTGRYLRPGWSPSIWSQFLWQTSCGKVRSCLGYSLGQVRASHDPLRMFGWGTDLLSPFADVPRGQCGSMW